MEIDSVNVTAASINMGFPNNRVEYRWLSNSEKIPVLEVTGTEVAGVFTPTTIRYRDIYRAAPPSVFGPKARFSCDKTQGVKSTDTFQLVNNSTPPFGNTYQWTITPSAGVRFVKSTTATSANPVLVFDNAGTYSVKLSATNFSGTDDSTATGMITITDPSSGLDALGAVKNTNLVYPNPVSTAFQLNNKAFENEICMIFDATGKLVLEKRIPSDMKIDCSALTTGLYTVVVKAGGTWFTERFIKE